MPVDSALAHEQVRCFSCGSNRDPSQIEYCPCCLVPLCGMGTCQTTCRCDLVAKLSEDIQRPTPKEKYHGLTLIVINRAIPALICCLFAFKIALKWFGIGIIAAAIWPDSTGPNYKVPDWRLPLRQQSQQDNPDDDEQNAPVQCSARAVRRKTRGRFYPERKKGQRGHSFLAALRIPQTRTNRSQGKTFSETLLQAPSTLLRAALARGGLLQRPLAWQTST